MVLILAGAGQLDVQLGDLAALHPGCRFGALGHVAGGQQITLQVLVRQLRRADQLTQPLDLDPQRCHLVVTTSHRPECSGGPAKARGRRARSVASPAVGPAVVRRQRLVLAVAAIAVCWVLLTPPGGGPDEASHLARAGGVARGDLDGVDIGVPGARGFELPDSYVLPEAACYAQQPTVPASCAVDPQPTGATVVLPSTSYDYPVWAHLVTGVPSLLPAFEPVWWARLGGAAVAVALVAASLVVAARDRSQLTAPAVLLAVTPMAWFSFAVVNPSSIAIAGGLALWTGLLARPASRASAGWLAAAGYTALALPRRDGMIWAALVLVIALVASRRTLLDWLRSLPRSALGLVAATTLVSVAWSVTRDSRVSQLSALGPIFVLAAEAVRTLWRRRPGRGPRAALLVGVAVVAVAGVWFVLTTRPGGLDWDHTLLVIGESGNNLVEAIGVLGWLDAVLPWSVVVTWLAVLGVLAAATLLDSWRPLALAAAVLAVALASAWAFELYHGDMSGTYWQGRYSLPLLAGIPLVLAAGIASARDLPAVRLVLIVAPLAIVNIAAWSAARRFAVGTDGALMPWSWDGTFAWAPPLALLVVHAVATAVLGVAVMTGRAERADG